MQVCQLMSWSWVPHTGSFMNFIGLLIYYKCVCGIYTPWIIFLFLSSNYKYLILGLNTIKLSWQLICISQLDTLSGLTWELMNVQSSMLLIKVMKSRLHRWKNIVRVKTYDIMKKSSKFINFSSDLYIRSCIFIEEV